MSWFYSRSSFSPSDLTSMVLWLKADAIVGLVDTDPVSTWSDASGAGNNWTQTLTKRPLYRTGIQNGLPSVRFDGSNDDFSGPTISTTGVFSLFIVQRTTGDCMFFSNDSSAGRQLLRIGQSGGNTVSTYDGTANRISSTLAKARSSASLVELVRTTGGGTGDVFFYEDGVARGVGSSVFGTYTTKFFGSYEGASLWLNGDIFEVILYHAAVSAGQRAQVEGYLISKWAL